MLKVAIGALAGVLYGLGLAVSRLVDPARVMDFLVPFRGINPRVPITMGLTGLLAALAFSVSRGWRPPPVGSVFRWPAQEGSVSQIVAGSLFYGTGWGLVGYCPGPAVASLGLGVPAAWLFVAGMIVGMAVWDYGHEDVPVIAAAD